MCEQRQVNTAVIKSKERPVALNRISADLNKLILQFYFRIKDNCQKNLQMKPISPIHICKLTIKYFKNTGPAKC